MSECIFQLAERMAAAARKGVAVERLWHQHLEDDPKKSEQEQVYELNHLSKAS